MAWLDDALDRVARGRVAVFGDLALDAYWMLDSGHRETSLETGLPVHRVASQRYSLGGAANVVANLIDLGVAAAHAIGLVGDDLFGRELRAMLADRGAGTDGILQGPPEWQTLVFAKPHRDDAEESRLDFGTLNALPSEAIDRLVAELERAAAASSDAVVINQQAPAGIVSEECVGRINDVIARHPERVFVVDSRARPELFRGAVVTINAAEAERWLGGPAGGGKTATPERAREMAVAIQSGTGQAVFISLGSAGIAVADGTDVHVVPGIPVPAPTDPVGAGDTVTATLAAVLGSGGDPLTAARLANLAAAVTVAKLRVTGTATAEEIRALASQHPGTEGPTKED